MMDKFYKLPADIASRRDLNSSDKILFAVIKNHLRNNSFCWPGKRTLMRETGLASKTVCDSIHRLEETGLLVVERPGNGKSNHYKSGSESEPVQRVNRFRNDTTTGSGSEPEAVQRLNQNRKKKRIEADANSFANTMTREATLEEAVLL